MKYLALRHASVDSDLANLVGKHSNFDDGTIQGGNTNRKPKTSKEALKDKYLSLFGHENKRTFI